MPTTQKQIAERYKISKSTVRRVLKENNIEPLFIGRDKQTQYYEDSVNLLFTESNKHGESVEIIGGSGENSVESEQIGADAVQKIGENLELEIYKEENKELLETLKIILEEKKELNEKIDSLREESIEQKITITKLETAQEYEENKIKEQEAIIKQQQEEIDRLKNRSFWDRLFNKQSFS